ncbi:MAG: phenylalanine--tRNA ligase subunit beta, partial [Eubacteriales bacterium]|nr:phenylalanine--tRNA ligase subunit beta [Eubacteriales bacterium]
YDDDFNKRAGIRHSGRLKIANPHAQSANTLRDSMVPSLLQMAEGNARYFDSLGIFEVGSVFNLKEDSKTCSEHKNLCVLCASRTESEDNLFLKLKGIFTHMLFVMRKLDAEYSPVDSALSWMHPSKALTISASGEELGYLTVVHPAVCEKIDKKLKLAVLEIRMDVLSELEERKITFNEPSKYQEVNLDFNFLADGSTSFEKFESDVDSFKHEILMKNLFVDIYSGKGLPEGKKSMTFRFVLGSRERTLSSEEISAFSDELLGYMKDKGYVLR